MNKFHIYTYPRIHFSLIGMNRDGYRINGGAGCSIADPIIDCLFEDSENLSIIDLRNNGFTELEKRRLIRLINEIASANNFRKRYKCIISGDVLSHAGFGSNTMIYLSCTEALFIINNAHYDRDTIIDFSNRGGTSGIGINTYFLGGFIFDTGINCSIDNDIRPSCIGKRCQRPLTICHITPPKWEMGIFIPYDIVRKTEEEEINFFKNYPTISQLEVKDILYEIVYGITSSIQEGAFNTFCHAINQLQKTKWKDLEYQLYDSTLKQMACYIHECGATAVGLSSLGPMLYFFGQDIHTINNHIQNKYSNSMCITTHLNPNKRRIIWE